MSVLVDPWYLSFNEGRDDPDAYVQRLLHVYDAFKSEYVSLEISALAASLLEEDGSFPLSAALPPSLWTSRSDVFRIVGTLIDRLPKIEDGPVAAILHEGAEVAPAIEEAISELRQEHLVDLSVIVALRRMESMRGGEMVLVGFKVENPVRVVATLVDVECSQPGVTCPYVIAGEDITWLDDVRSYADVADSMHIAAMGDTRIAVAMEVSRASGDAFKAVIDDRTWRLGARFAESLLSCGVIANPGRFRSAMRACVRAILREGQREMHALRQGRGGNSPQVIRAIDGARAWRMDVDDELHLHLWTIGGITELARVVFHNDFTID